MNASFRVVLVENFQGQRNILTEWYKNLSSISSKSILITGSGLSRPSSLNGTVLCNLDGKSSSWTKLTSPEFWARFEFSATFSSERNSIFQNFKNEDNFARYTKIFEIFSRKFFPLNLAPGIFRILGWMVRFPKHNSSGISGNFSEKFLYHLPLFPRVDSFATYAYSGRIFLLELFIVFELKTKNSSRQMRPLYAYVANESTLNFRKFWLNGKRPLLTICPNREPTGFSM